MRPPSFTLSLSALLALPYRLCNPPPAAGNVRSCKVTPLIKVTLDDVLNKRHLPPLTLKDFEEWLVFVEGCPQYLYFILWLREYESRYAAWLAESGCARPASPSASKFKFSSTSTLASPASDLSYINLIPSSAPLALFFTRAKQTFLDPSAALSLGPAALAALGPSTHSLSPSIPHFSAHAAPRSALPEALAGQPHPHPRELAPLALHARAVLKASLARFAETACHNVGTRRAWCGIAGGTMIALALGLLPALAALFLGRARWWRLVGLFGCWLGGTIIISSFHGICMMIYVFGDLRQLRSFELARPAISDPRAIARARPRLRSLLTRPELASEESGDPGSAPAPTPSDSAAKEGEKAEKQSVSATSTGTPVVHLGSGALHPGGGVGAGTTSAGTAEAGFAEETEDDFGIEVSPAYYYPEAGTGAGGEVGDGVMGGEAVAEEGEGGTKESVGVRSVGMVFKWVFGRGGESAAESRGGVVSADQEALSHAGTFGVRSWSGGLGSLPPAPDPDLERGDACKTAEFIAHEYPVEADAVQEKPVASNFDFDKLPVPPPTFANLEAPTAPQPPLPVHPGAPLATRTPELRLQIPLLLPSLTSSTAASTANTNTNTAPTTTTAPTTAPSTTTGATTTTPAPVPAARQWWDTCPRHPAVIAITTASASLTHSHSSPAASVRSRTPYTSPYAVATLPAHSPSPADSTLRTRLRAITSVPAFGPLTRVLSPVVARGQWEIVVRSAGGAMLGAWVVVGCVVALPEAGAG